MGNCCRRESSMVWADDDDEEWVYTVAPENPTAEKQTLLEQSPKNSSSSSSSKREVKIKISKKQLEELLGGAELHDIPMDQVLTRLIDASYHFEVHQRSWRPNLQSIPEDAY